MVDAVHRVAAGHPTATVAVLDHLRGAEHVRASIDRPGGLVTPTTERDLLVRMVRGLCSTDPQALESLTTLAAARNPADAELLLQRPPGEPALLPPAVGRLLDVPALWTANDDLDRPAPAAFLRHLLLRRLAERGSGWSSGHPDWPTVHTALASRAVDDVGRLHHRLALRDAVFVVRAMGVLLESVPGSRFLRILDAVVAVPDLSRTDGDDAMVDTAPGLVTRLQLLADPRATRQERIHHHLAVALDYEAASAQARSQQGAFLNRAAQARRSADALA